MILACIVCGGYLETMLIIMGLSAILNWWKRRHDKNKCKCCKDQEKKHGHE